MCENHYYWYEGLNVYYCWVKDLNKKKLGSKITGVIPSTSLSVCHSAKTILCKLSLFSYLVIIFVPVFLYLVHVYFLFLEWPVLRKHMWSANRRVVEADGTCAICMIEYQKGSKVFMLPCQARHVFHNKCIRTWLGQKAEDTRVCPLDREVLTDRKFRMFAKEFPCNPDAKLTDSDWKERKASVHV